ncbi:type II secretion system protein E [Methanococcoides burtonii DSM 6242]|uniref:Type II secretion system protein E n=1 Tax=Methanococcoides burtonii (strain DSM 6242 / NBRC 107633 / OCM 468 / ACE-M) TaxID=259564 RepID=Q12ZQ7_METBU|nr:type II secretion system protein E [Methanococcoides burtonii DSM 6242]
MTDRPEKLYMIIPREYNLDTNTLKMIERVRKKLIRFRPDDMNFANPANSSEYFRRIGKKMIEEDARSHNIALAPADVNSYSELLAKYTTGLGILEDILSDTRVTDVYINAPADKNPVHVLIDGDECITNIFLSQDDLDSMVSRFRAISGRPFGEATPILEMELKEFGVRVSVIGDPLSANGLAYAFRKHSRRPWTLPKLIATGSISPLTAGLLSFLMDGETSILVAGEVRAGKTSLLSAMIMEIPQKYRILTIEDTREIPIEDLQELGWKMQGMSSRSSILNTNLEIRPEVALRATLRLGNSSLVIGEVRGEEVKVLYEAMQVGAAGNSELGTIHGASASAVYERIVHTLGVPPASFKATDAVVVCTNTRVGGSMSKKRRVTQICEVVSGWDETADANDIFADIMEYNAATDSLVPTDILDRGQSELVGKIAHKWGISIDTASLNIRIRGKIKEKMAIAGQTNPDLIEAEAVSKANNMFWLYMDREKNGSEGPDYENVYQKWSDWFDKFSSTYI